MRKSFWIGLVLLVVGLIVGLSGPTYDETTVGMGDARVEVRDREGVSSWLGWVGAGIGLVLMISSLRGESGPPRTYDQHRPHTS